jgi:hypothetical protein
MTIHEVRKNLPNGFHDSDICSISIDYVRGEAIFLIDVDLSGPEGKVEPSSRFGELQLKGLLYCVIEPPRFGGFTKEYAPSDSRLWIASDSSDFSILKNSPVLPEPLPDNSFRHWFFISSDNSFIYVAAMNANWVWKD